MTPRAQTWTGPNASARALNRNAAEFASRTGVINLKLESWQEAWTLFDTAARAQPWDAFALYGRGLAAQHLGRMTEGWTDIARAERFDRNIGAFFADLGVKR